MSTLQTQAAGNGSTYGALMPEDESMLRYLARAAWEMRVAKGRKQVHIAASASIDQSTIWRFEHGESWPRDPDHVIAAYADDLDVPAIEIWKRAIELWTAGQATPGSGVPLLEDTGRTRRDAAQAQTRKARDARRGKRK